MALGVPVVVRQAPGCHEAVVEEGGGVAVSPVKDTAEAVLPLLRDTARRTELPARGRVAGQQRYCVERPVEDLWVLYTDRGTTGGTGADCSPTHSGGSRGRSSDMMGDSEGA